MSSPKDGRFVRQILRTTNVSICNALFCSAIHLNSQWAPYRNGVQIFKSYGWVRSVVFAVAAMGYAMSGLVASHAYVQMDGRATTRRRFLAVARSRHTFFV